MADVLPFRGRPRPAEQPPLPPAAVDPLALSDTLRRLGLTIDPRHAEAIRRALNPVYWPGPHAA